MDVRDRVAQLQEALVCGLDPEDWLAPGARVDLPALGVERDARDLLVAFGLPRLAACRLDVVRQVRNVLFVNWDATLPGGRGGTGSAVVSWDREGRITHLRVEGALLAFGG